jgi:hypothetical protein
VFPFDYFYSYCGIYKQQSKGKRGQVKKRESETGDKIEHRNNGAESDSLVESSSSNSLSQGGGGGSRKHVLDTFHNAQQPSCSKCLKLLERSWKWTSLEKKEQSMFLSDIQRDNKHTFSICDDDILKELSEIQCATDRGLVQEVMQELRKSLISNQGKGTKSPKSASLDMTSSVKLVLKPPRSHSVSHGGGGPSSPTTTVEIVCEHAVGLVHLDQLVQIIKEAGSSSELSVVESAGLVNRDITSSCSNGFGASIELSELFFPPPHMFIEAVENGDAFVPDYLVAHDSASRERERKKNNRPQHCIRLRLSIICFYMSACSVHFFLKINILSHIIKYANNNNNNNNNNKLKALTCFSIAGEDTSKWLGWWS